jgi:hypothetical protein
MQTVANTRSEKNLIDAKADHAAIKLKESNQRKIEHLESFISDQKESIKDCLDQDYFDIALAKLERVRKAKAQLLDLRNA